MVGRFRESSMAEEDSAGGSDLGHDSCLSRVPASEEDQTSFACVVLVVCEEVVLDQEGNPMEWATDALFGTFLVELRCYVEGIWVYFTDGAEVTGQIRLNKAISSRELYIPIGLMDSGRVTRHQIFTSQTTKNHPSLKLLNGSIFNVDAIAQRHREGRRLFRTTSQDGCIVDRNGANACSQSRNHCEKRKHGEVSNAGINLRVACINCARKARSSDPYIASLSRTCPLIPVDYIMLATVLRIHVHYQLAR